MDKNMEAVVMYRGVSYDVGRFLDKHPGGSQLISAVAGTDIEDFLHGQRSLDGKTHSHSLAAFRILHKYSVQVAPTETQPGDELVDLEKPVLEQVGRLGKHYWAWIHRPVDKDLRMFHSDFMEWFTRNHWSVIPFVWLPLTSLFLWLALTSFPYQVFGSGLVAVALLLMAGTFWWTAMEYLLHRFVFHWRPSPESPRQLLLHFLLHGLHHKTPMDKGRLVFPPPMGALFVAVAFLLYRWLMPLPVCLAFGSGNLFGYVCYDVTHYYLHHGAPPAHSYRHWLKLYHHNHHFKNPDKSFGITSQFWDVWFGTEGA